MRVLIVDDEPELCAQIARTLKEQQYAVDVAGDGAEALLRAEGRRAEGVRGAAFLEGAVGQVPQQVGEVRDPQRDRLPREVGVFVVRGEPAEGKGDRPRIGRGGENGRGLRHGGSEADGAPTFGAPGGLIVARAARP